MLTIKPETFAFLEALSANNKKDWFSEHRADYEAHWLDEAKRFVADLGPVMSQLDPPHMSEAKINGSIRRINRDVRFSQDKSPYNPRLHLVFYTGHHAQKSPAIHIVVQPDGVGMGAGQWSLTKDELARYYEAVIDAKSGQALEALVSDCEAKGLRLTDESLKRLPRGMPEDTGRDTFLKRKGLVVLTGDQHLDPAGLSNETEFLRLIETVANLNSWLCKHVYDGPS